MVQNKIYLLQGEIKFSPKFTNAQIQHIRGQIAQPIRHLSIANIYNTIESKEYPRFIQDENELRNEIEYIIGLLKAVKPRVKFSGEILGYRENHDEHIYKKCRWFVRKDDDYFTHEYIDFRIVKKGKPRGPKPPPFEPSRILKPNNRVDVVVQTNRPGNTNKSTQASSPPGSPQNSPKRYSQSSSTMSPVRPSSPLSPSRSSKAQTPPTSSKTFLKEFEYQAKETRNCYVGANTNIIILLT